MMKTRALPALLTALVLAAPAHADSSSSSSSSNASSTNGRTTSRNSSSQSNHRDQDDARDALRRGQVMPLTAILEIAFKRERGTVLEVDLETDDGILVYQIELLTQSGRKVEMSINARNGEFMRVRYP